MTSFLILSQKMENLMIIFQQESSSVQKQQVQKFLDNLVKYSAELSICKIVYFHCVIVNLSLDVIFLAKFVLGVRIQQLRVVKKGQKSCLVLNEVRSNWKLNLIIISNLVFNELGKKFEEILKVIQNLIAGILWYWNSMNYNVKSLNRPCYIFPPKINFGP